MDPVDPLEVLLDGEGVEVRLPAELAAFYGRFRFPARPARPWVMANFVATLDGVVALEDPMRATGAAISGSNEHDRLLMGLLRALADAVIIGTGTLSSVPRHLWKPDAIYPPMAAGYEALRASLGKSAPPLNVIVTARGDLDFDLPVLRAEAVRTLVVTTSGAAESIRQRASPRLDVVVAGPRAPLGARAILQAVAPFCANDVILLEGGPNLMSHFLEERAVDDLFLTLAPQIAGRDGAAERPGLAAGARFAPADPRWFHLRSVRRGGDHLFLRYVLSPDPGPKGS